MQGQVKQVRKVVKIMKVHPGYEVAVPSEFAHQMGLRPGDIVYFVMWGPDVCITVDMEEARSADILVATSKARKCGGSICISIKKDVRDLIGIDVGDRVAWYEFGGKKCIGKARSINAVKVEHDVIVF